MGVRVPPGAQRPPSVRSTGGGSAFLPSTPSGVLFSCPCRDCHGPSESVPASAETEFAQRCPFSGTSVKKFALLATNHSFCAVWEPAWRAPEGPEGTGGLRGAAPNEVRPPSLAGGRGLRRPEHPWGYKQSGPAGHPKQNLRNWEASRPTARSAGNAILKSPGHPQCRRRNAPRALPGTTR